jgi:hypothetical protein
VSEPRERAWDDVHELLPRRWRAGPTSNEPGRRRWSVTAGPPKLPGLLQRLADRLLAARHKGEGP